jgi:Arc/MetJ-type ribon-helix-helix transcriptional regulator
MTIHVSKDVENAINAAVQSGEFTSPNEMIDKLVRDYQHRTRSPRAAREATEETAFDVASRAGLIGCIKGTPRSPTDLSTNPKHMEGFGRG